MKTRSALTWSLIAGLLALSTGCSDQLPAIEYNNGVVEAMNQISSNLETTTLTYDTGIPNIVTETTSLDMTGIQSAYEGALLKVEASKTILTLTSRNIEQETAVKAEFKNYLALADAYLNIYAEMIDYYTSGRFTENLDQVETYDITIHENYNTFVDSHNTLVDILGQYVD